MRQTARRGKLMRIGELARRARVSVRTLRFYEEVGLLRPVARTEADYRLYDRAALRRLRTIKRMKLLGLKLAEIKQLTETYERVHTCDPVRQQLHSLLHAQIARVDEQMAELAQLRQHLQQYLDRAESYFRDAPTEMVEQRCRGALTPSQTLMLGGESRDHESDRPRR